MAPPIRSRMLFSILAVCFGFAFTYLLIQHHSFIPVSDKTFEPAIAEIGTQMLSTTAHGYVLPFEVVSMLLLAAMVGCIVIAMKSKPEKA